MLLSIRQIFAATIVYLAGNIGAFQYIRKHGPKPTPYHDFDYLMYAQRWPITSCSEWKEANKVNTCTLPQDKTTWTVHGIWPTKTGTEGPLFCPSSIHFDPDQLQPIMSDLQRHWTNVEANTKPNSFWKHEWDKHGTCSSVLPQLNSVTNFFKQGLEWNKQFKLSDILMQSKIMPGSTGYTAQEIYDAVKSYTKTDPMIQCVIDRVSKQSLINEIRICFNKSMELIDCDHTNPVNNQKTSILSNCDMKKPVMYLEEVPMDSVSYEMDYPDEDLRQEFEEQIYYMRLYRFLKFLIWFTT